MTGANKVAYPAAALSVLFTFSSMPARAQFAGPGGGSGGMMSMLPQLMQTANFGGGGHHHYRHRRRH